MQQSDELIEELMSLPHLVIDAKRSTFSYGEHSDGRITTIRHFSNHIDRFEAAIDIANQIRKERVVEQEMVYFPCSDGNIHLVPIRAYREMEKPIFRLKNRLAEMEGALQGMQNLHEGYKEKIATMEKELSKSWKKIKKLKKKK